MNYPKPIHFRHVCESPISFPMNKNTLIWNFVYLPFLNSRNTRIKLDKICTFNGLLLRPIFLNEPVEIVGPFIALYSFL